MADHNDEDMPPPAPVFPPKAPREAVIIEGEAREVRETDDAPDTVGETSPAPATEVAAEPETGPTETAPALEEARDEPAGVETSVSSESPRPAGSPRRAMPFGFGLGGAVVGAAAALAAAWAFDPRAGALNELAARTDATQSSMIAEAQGRKALETRLTAVEAAAGATVKASDLRALDERIAKLEAAPVVTPAALAAVQAEARAAREAASKALSGAAASAPTTGAAPETAAPPAVDLSAIEARLARLESASAGSAAAPPPPPPPADPRLSQLEAAQSHTAQTLSGLQGDVEARLAKLEAALAAPKAETRVAPDEVAPRPDAAAEGIAALALEQQLAAGRPFSTEWSALSRLGADSAALAALKPFAETGAPSASALAAAFAKVATSAMAAAEPAPASGLLDKLAAEAGRMVKVHPVGEVVGDDPQALATQIQAALARGQIEAAFALWKKWPESARKASAEWGRSLEGRAGADAAAKALREGALARLAPTKN